MGLGGYLMWTPLLKQLNSTCILAERTPDNKFKPVWSDLFLENPRVLQAEWYKNYLLNSVQKTRETIFDRFDWKKNYENLTAQGLTVIQLNDSSTNYCKFDSNEKCVQRHDKHVIHQICEHFGFNDVELKCELFLTTEEMHFGRRWKDYVVIEPNTKDEYTVNKRYPLEKWQCVVDDLVKRGYRVVQVGRSDSPSLQRVESLVGLTTFRQAAATIAASRLFVGSEGGLMHAANAVGTPAVIIVTGFLHPRMTCYPENDNIWVGESKNHHSERPCGLKIRCAACETECREHDVNDVIEKILRRLEK